MNFDPQFLLIFILALIITGFIFDKALSFVNLKHGEKPIPEDLKDVFSQEQHQKSKDYRSTNYKFGWISGAFSLIITVLFIGYGGFGKLNLYLSNHFDFSPIVQGLIFFGILFIASDLISTPFSWYHTFVIEEKFGFNKTTPKVFWTDKLKGYLLGAILGGIILGALLFLLYKLGPDFWWIFWIVITVFIIFMNMFYTTLIMPLFNKFTPLEEGDLRTAIENYSKKVNFPLTNIFVIDGSKRSTKANAFFSGFGKNKKVVLYDTLVENHSVEELTAVFAHEVGHFKKKHIIGSLILSILQTGLMLFIMKELIFLPELSKALGAESLTLHINLITFSLLYSPISTILSIGMNIFSRRNEYEADNYARTTYSAEPLITALKKLSSDNLSNLTPHPFYVWLNYSHPPLIKRIKALRSE
ncbi:M48 family metallopeptidase [Marinigracilibium pacificum]|uniref:M48 family metallopeptidase n=1 Tax=Marinigracilibium pacificum TaxID=2729599 RepID=A0A848IX06_9BACT|nr:M48 family metallopeptidase [Marinigracilibium pacificum]NMM48847.1 M48 family metallopeptidase [Marinigracilibium pacificum]